MGIRGRNNFNAVKLGLLACLAVLVFAGFAFAQVGDILRYGTIGGSDVAAHQVGTQVILANSCDYDWWYGCSPTSAGMVMGHYDRNGYGTDPLTNKYPALVSGGVAEAETYVGPPTGSSAFANNAIASSGHIADFWTGYGNSGDDPLGSGRAIPAGFNCLADFMGTSQDASGNSDGSTTFWYYTDGAKLYSMDIYGAGASYYDSSGMYGMYEYVDHCGYGTGTPSTDTNFFNQYIIEYGATYGFTFAEYKAEIDDGRPVLIHVEDHTMFGYGYDDTGGAQTVYLHDTWTAGQHSMTWAGSYSGLAHYGVTCITVTNGVPEPGTMVLLSVSGVLVLLRRRRSAGA